MGQAEFLGIESNPLFESLLRNSTVVTITVDQDDINADPRLQGMLGQQIQAYLQADGKLEPILN